MYFECLKLWVHINAVWCGKFTQKVPSVLSVTSSFSITSKKLELSFLALE